MARWEKYTGNTNTPRGLDRGRGALEVVSVLPDRDSISTGQQNIPVNVTILNGSPTNTIRIDSVSLSISRGTYSSLFVLPGFNLGPTDNAVFTVNVDVLSSSVSGVATIDASVYGVDLDDNLNDILDVGADLTASWLVQQAVDISITDNTPIQVSTNQAFVTELTVVNSGGPCV